MIKDDIDVLDFIISEALNQEPRGLIKAREMIFSTVAFSVSVCTKQATVDVIFHNLCKF